MKKIIKNLLLILNILLTSVLIVSCNDDSSLDNNDEIQQINCSENIKKECLVGKWKIDTVFINDKEHNMTTKQKKQHIEFGENDKASIKMFLIRKDKVLLSEKKVINVSDADYSIIDDGGIYKKIKVDKDNLKLEIYIKGIKNNKLTLLSIGKTKLNNKDYELETIWIRD